MKASLKFGRPRAVNPVAIQFSVNDTTSIGSPVHILPGDSRIRLLGGRHLRGPSYPYEGYLTPQAVNYFDPQLALSQFSTSRYGLNPGIEFTLPSSQTTFEIVMIDQGNPGPIEIAIDGSLTNDSGYQYQHRFDGSFRFVKIQLPDSAVSRLVTVYTPSFPFGGLFLPTGNTLGPLSADAVNYASIVFEGDSITEGAVASIATKTWIMHAAYLLGIRNPINMGVGSTGYLSRRPGQVALLGRIDNVTTAVNGGPPDAIVVAAGINDCSIAPPTPFPIPDVGNAALTYFRALRAAAPNSVIIVLGPFTGSGGTYTQTSASCRDAIFAAAQQVSLTYTVDVADWVTPANVGIVFNGNANGPHPVDAGHQIYGDRAATAIRAIIQSLP